MYIRLGTLIICLSGFIAVKSQNLTPLPYSTGALVNYVRAWDLSLPIQDTTGLRAMPVESAKQTTQYFDGLGRPVQTVAKQITPAKNDLVNPQMYDETGRETYKYPAFSSSAIQSVDVSNDGNFKMDGFWQDSVFTFKQYPGENYIYNEILLEPSPLARPIQNFPLGNSWIGSGHGSSIQYLMNTALDSVRIWTIPDASGGLPSSTTAYAAGVLYKTVSTDEAGHMIVEYKDKSGLVILKKVQLYPTPSVGHTGWLNTYYVYDNLNNLRFVISPSAFRIINGTWTISTALASELCFRYEYDHRGRMIIKKVPGAGEVWMVYDMRDRPVMTQDSNLRIAGKWLVSVFDSLNRVVLTGLLTNSNNRVYHQNLAYTSMSYPSIASGFEALSKNFYDNYSWVAGTGSGLGSDIDSSDFTNATYFATSFGASPEYAVRMSRNNQTRGILTGTQTEIVNSGGKYLYQVSFYDDHSRVIQSAQTNVTGGRDTVSVQYNFDGKTIRSYLKHLKSGNTIQNHYVLTKLEYDHADRLKHVWKTVDHASVVQLIDSVQYDELSELQTKFLGNNIDNLVYAYNIRGWLTEINKNYLTAASGNYFGMELGYDKTPNAVGTNYNGPQYNGNITGTIWKSAGDGVGRRYDYTYDNVNRLTNAYFIQNTSGTAWDSAYINYTASNLSYDANGNILTMNQKGFTVGGSSLIDQLTYTYIASTNKLSQVNDAVNNPTSTLGDFHYAGTKQATDYSYDGNGNLNLDNNKAISIIAYNYLNLPQQVTVTAKGTISYTYDATGNKLVKTTIDNTVTPAKVTTTKYIGGFVYQTDSLSGGPLAIDTLQFIMHEEGRTRWAYHKYLNGSSAYGFEYDFFEKDHLGNTRIILTQEKDSAGYLASMEAATRSTEVQLFSNITTTCYARNLVSGYPDDLTYSPVNDSVSRLDGNGPRLGPTLLLKVMAGDNLDMLVQSYYIGSGTPASPVNSFTDVLNSLAGGIVSITAGGKGTLAQLTTNGSNVYSAVTAFMPSDPPTTNKPKAYLNWITLDDQLKAVSSGASVIGNASVLNTEAFSGCSITKSGYIYIWVSNETPGWPVYFDNLKVVHRPGPLLEETHYYPFGLTMAGISDKALKTNYAQNKYRYNGKELQNQEFSDGTGLEEYDYGARFYDQQIGRFNTIDPLSDKTSGLSPYSYGTDNPILNIDVEGKFSINNHYLFTVKTLNDLGYSASASDLIGHYASTYSDNPEYKGNFAAGAITFFEGQPYRNGINYSATNNSQDPNSVLNNTWHSMKANGETVSDEFAMRRGQEFGWSKIFEAANEVKKVGGLNNLKKNSKGIEALGQGIHALQDAVAHHGEDLSHHSLSADIYPSNETESKALKITTGAILVTEIMSGNNSHISSDMSINVSGMSNQQLGTFMQSLLKGMNEKNVKKVNINNNP